MARKLRIQYPGAIYHVMNRGDPQERVFCDDDDGRMFLATLAEGCEMTGWQIHSYCLMANHIHLVIETPKANLVEAMKWLLGVYMLLVLLASYLLPSWERKVSCRIALLASHLAAKLPHFGRKGDFS